MILFWRLVLAHVVADFPLQTDAVFALKTRKKWGVLLHGACFGLTCILFTTPFLKSAAVWSGLAFLWLSHIAIDKAKLVLIGRGQRDHLGYFLLDQALHIGAIALVGLFLNHVPRVTSLAADSAVSIGQFKLGVVYIISVWASPLFCFYTRAAFSPQNDDFKAQQPVLWRILGYVERGMLTAAVVQGGGLLFLVPVIFFPRIGLAFFTRKREFSLWELILGSVIAIAVGIWGRRC
jgi:hypothetical protein